MGATAATLANVVRPAAVANVIRGSVLLVAGVVTDSEDAITLGRQIASGSSESSSSSGIREPSPEEVSQMHEELKRWKRELSKAKTLTPDADAGDIIEELERREAELKLIEEKHRQLEEDVRNYPRPAFLEEDGDVKTVNIAVVGNSGVGKSLLINTFRGVKASPSPQVGEEDWAPVGVNQTTSEPVAYPMPGQRNIKLWDLAGAGSQYFPRGDYTRAIGLRFFDIVLVVTTCRFTQTEAVLLSELASNSVPSFLVRTMVDVDIASNVADHGQSEVETKRGISDDLRERGVPSPYLVNARELGEHDFPRLQEDVLRVAHEGPEAHPQARANAQKKEKESSRRQPAGRQLTKFEAGEPAEVWSKPLNLWVRCSIEAKGSNPDEYDISLPGAGGISHRIPKVHAIALRKAQAFKVGDDVEVIILKGPKAGSWVRCRIMAEGSKPDTYNCYIPESPPERRNVPDVHVAALRKVSEASPLVPKPLVDAADLKQILKEFKDICSAKEFQDTIESLQEIGTQNHEVRMMKKTFVSHQFSPVLNRHQLPATKIGWSQFLTFTRTQGTDADVAKLSHEVERLMRVRVGDFFGIRAGQGEQVTVQQACPKRLKDACVGLLLRKAHQYTQAAEAQSRAAVPASRAQRAAAKASTASPFMR